MQDPDHLGKLAKAGNIAVVLGKPSGLVSLDFDDEGALTEFCSHNPTISQALITAASRALIYGYECWAIIRCAPVNT